MEKERIITKENILKYLTEEEIFSLAFGFEPIEGEYVTSPFRSDQNPGCWFQTDINTNRLRFIDFANNDVINNIIMRNIDCFNAVQVYYKFNNFYSTLQFIKLNLIDNKSPKLIKRKRKIIKVSKKKIKKVKKKVNILIDIKNLDNEDDKFWNDYGITKQNLIDDNVFSVKKFKLLNTRSGNMLIRVNDLCYSFSNFEDNRKKLYRPNKKGKYKFVTNCKASDIGEINSLIESEKQLIISKSYKDCRVLRNKGLNSIWFQNEGMIPSKEIMIDLCKRFNKIIVFFDNDNAGITASIKVRNYINNLFPNKATNLYLPIELNQYNIKDPSDLYKLKGNNHLKTFIKNKIYDRNS